MAQADVAAVTRRVAWKAHSVFERIDIERRSERDLTHELDSEPAETFFDEWCEDAFGGDRTLLEDRIAAAGVSEEAIHAALVAETWPEDVPLPDWTEEVDDLTTRAREYDATVPEADSSLPFVHAVESWVDHCWATLTETHSFSRFDESAAERIRGWLRRRFVALSVEPLYVEFQTYVTMRRPRARFGELPADESPETDLYDEFVSDLRSPDRLWSLFDAYPVLARFVATAKRQWEAATVEFHDRLDADWDRLVDLYCPETDRATVSSLEVLTEDRHADGRAVIEVTLGTDTPLIYKPRSVDAERILYDLLTDVATELDVGFPTPRCLPREGYGWVEKWSPEPCETEADVESYYRRAGVLLAVARLLRLNDCHHENVIATDEGPLIVDAETILHPLGFESSDAYWRHSVARDGSVLMTGLLPGAYNLNDGDERESMSGFEPPEISLGQTIPRRPDAWEYRNTNRMTLRDEPTRYEPAPVEADNVPEFDGRGVLPEEHEAEIVAGFERAHRLLANDDTILTRFDEQLRELRTRFVYRSTWEYALTIARLSSAPNLEDGRNVTVAIDSLLDPRALEGADESIGYRLHEADRTALRRLDVPRFEAEPTGRRIYFDDEPLGVGFERPGFEAYERARNALDDADRAKQLEYVRFAFRPSHAPVLEDERAPFLDDTLSSVEPVADETVCDTIESLAADVLDERVTVDGDPTWVTHSVSAHETLQVSVNEYDLYGGSGGIGLFLAAAAAADGVSVPTDAALEAIDPVRRVPSMDDPVVDGIGAGEGFGSIVYALTVVGDVLSESSVLEDATRVAEEITVERIEDDEEYDVLAGAAGATLALLALWERREEDWLLERAVRCGEHLLEGRVETDVGPRAWPNPDASSPLSGFGHGASGVAYALYRLFDRTGDERFRDAGREALQYERRVYDPAVHNWPDFRGGTDDFMDGWCNGRAGAVLARIGIGAITDEVVVREDLRQTIDRVQTDLREQPDQLCCGNAGRAAILQTAGRSLEDETLEARGRRILDAMIRRRADAGTFALRTHTPRVYNAGLFMGTSGVGYALVRRHDPAAVPNALLFE